MHSTGQRFEESGKNPRSISVQDIKEATCLSYDERKLLRVIADRTVRIRAFYTSQEYKSDYCTCWRSTESKGPRLGTGYIYGISESNGPCPCKKCKRKKSKKCKYWMLTVNTASYIVCNMKEAEKATIDLFYDNKSSMDGGQVRSLTPIDFLKSESDQERCSLFCVTCDPAIIERIRPLSSLQPSSCEGDLLDSFRRLLTQGRPAFALVVSHPHGLPKKITMGSLWWDPTSAHRLEFNALGCYGSEGAPVLLINSNFPSKISNANLSLTCLMRTKVDIGIRYRYWFSQIYYSCI